jgi:hypothetical protein
VCSLRSCMRAWSKGGCHCSRPTGCFVSAHQVVLIIKLNPSMLDGSALYYQSFVEPNLPFSLDLICSAYRTTFWCLPASRQHLRPLKRRMHPCALLSSSASSTPLIAGPFARTMPCFFLCSHQEHPTHLNI